LTKSRGYPSILIDESLLLDCGDGTAQRLMEVNSMRSIKTICLSHLHGDHSMGLISLLWYYVFTNRKERLKIIAPSPVKKFIEKILDIFLPGVPFPFELDVLELGGESKVLEVEGGYILEYADMDHIIKAFGYRIEGKGGVLCYSGDTRFRQKLVELARDCDVLICESTFPDDKAEIAYQTGHCTPSDAAQMAKKADCKKLVLVHFSPLFPRPVERLIERIKSIFEREILIGEDLMTLELP
ncbi:MAG: MBL fold metallo-hydrolase, partial [Promethearchaeota archaeon]